MNDRDTQTTAISFGVYWRSKDGRGTHVWKEGLTEAEADAQVIWCEGAHPEATMVWALRGSDSTTHKLRMQGAYVTDAG